MIKNSKFFITGGAGFIGSWFIERIIDQNQVVIFDDYHHNAIQFASFRDHPNLKIIKGDILNKDDLEKALREDCDYVIHLAAIAGVPTVVRHPGRVIQVNLIGTYNLLNLLKGKKIKRFIDFSTSEVYGPRIFRASEEDMTTQGPLSKPRWVYATSKLASEYLTHGYYKEYGLPTVSIRPFNIYGPRQVGEGAIHNFVVNALKQKNIIVHGDGDSIRSWCYVSDLVDGILLICEQDGAVGDFFNIGNPQATSTTLELAKKVIEITASNSKIEFRDIAYPEVEIRVPSIRKAYSMLGFSPKIDYEIGLRNTVAWYKNNLKRL